MTKRARNHASDVRGLGRLAVEATLGVTGVVEGMHHTISSFAFPLGKRPEGRTRGITGLVYQAIRGVTGLVGATLDAALEQVVPLLGETKSFPEREALVAAFNGLSGITSRRRTTPSRSKCASAATASRSICTARPSARRSRTRQGRSWCSFTARR